jgi:hypothetical protein
VDAPADLQTVAPRRWICVYKHSFCPEQVLEIPKPKTSPTEQPLSNKYNPDYSVQIKPQQSQWIPSSESLHLVIGTSQHLTDIPFFRNAANYVSESIQGAGATASKEANKNVAKDNNASLSTRAQAAGDAISDKVDEQTHDRKADVHREAAKH